MHYYLLSLHNRSVIIFLETIEFGKSCIAPNGLEGHTRIEKLSLNNKLKQTQQVKLR